MNEEANGARSAGRGSVLVRPFERRVFSGRRQGRPGNVQIEAAGTSIHWPDIDEDIGVAQLLGVSEEDLFHFARFTIHSSRPTRSGRPADKQR